MNKDKVTVTEKNATCFNQLDSRSTDASDSANSHSSKGSRSSVREGPPMCHSRKNQAFNTFDTESYRNALIPSLFKRASRSASPQPIIEKKNWKQRLSPVNLETCDTVDAQQMMSRINQTKTAFQKRSHSDPYMQKNQADTTVFTPYSKESQNESKGSQFVIGSYSKSAILSKMSSQKKHTSSDDGIPLNVSPKNLVLFFDARKDNLSFSAISEDIEQSASILDDDKEESCAEILNQKSRSPLLDQDISKNPSAGTCTSRDSMKARCNVEDPVSTINISNNNKSNKSSDSGKKRKGYWYNVLSPNYKSKSEDFRKIFKDVPDTERLIVDYSCAMQKDILVHGRLYVTQNWICFYANIFKWETVMTLQFREITNISKERTARVIPNAISICTRDDRFFLTSFAARDKSYLMLFRVWQNALCDVQMNPSELWQWVHYSYGDELGLTTSDDDYVPPDAEDAINSHFEPLDLFIPSPSSSIKEPAEYDSGMLGCPNGAQPNESISNTSDTSAHNTRHQSRAKDRCPPSSLEVPAPGGPASGGGVVQDGRGGTPMEENDTTEDDDLLDAGEVQCVSHEHNGFTSLDDVFNIPVERLFEFIFTDSQLYKDFIAARKTFDFVQEPWPDLPNPDDGNKVRNISYTLSLNYSIGPKTSPSTEKQTWYGAYSKPGSIHVIDTEVVNGGVPYSDNFFVINRYCITRVTSNRSRLRITSQIKYRKNCWGLVKKMVEKAAIEGLITNFEVLGEFLHKEGERYCNAAPGLMPSKKKVLKRRRPAAIERRGDYNQSQSQLKHRTEYVPAHNIAKESSQEESQTGFNIELLVKTMCFLLMLLVFFNGVLYYKLLSLELQAAAKTHPHGDTQFTSHVPKTAPQSAEEWLKLLEQQEQLHDTELARWQDILTSSITLLDHMKQSLNRLKISLEERRGWHYKQDTQSD